MQASYCSCLCFRRQSSVDHWRS